MNKTILITGGTGKVGTQLVKHFFLNGLNVIFTSKDTAETNSEIEKIKKIKASNKILQIPGDLVEKDAISKIISVLERKNLFPHYLVNCARNIQFLKISPDGITQRPEFLGEFTLDVIVPYELTMALAHHPSSQLKHIINISSTYGIVPANPSLYKNSTLESPIQYSIAKAAQIHLAKELAIRLAPRNIQVNCVSFGGIEGRVDEDFKKRYAQLCPLGRMLKEEEVIGAIDFLISEKSHNITGHNLVVDGGWTIW